MQKWKNIIAFLVGFVFDSLLFALLTFPPKGIISMSMETESLESPMTQLPASDSAFFNTRTMENKKTAFFPQLLLLLLLLVLLLSLFVLFLNYEITLQAVSFLFCRNDDFRLRS